MESQASNTNGSSGHLSHASNEKVGPILPIFVQMNIRHEEPYIHWKETSRWVKFQEDVEEGGKRWSKPFVPALQFTALAQLRDCLQNGIVMLDLPANNLDDMIGQIKIKMAGKLRDGLAVCLNDSQCESLLQLLKEDVKLRIKTGILSHVSNRIHNAHLGATPSAPVTVSSSNGGPVPETDEDPDKKEPPKKLLLLKSKKKISILEGLNGPQGEMDEITSRKRHNSSNPFAKKIPKGAESALIQVATVSFVDKPTVVFLRLEEALSFDHMCEIPTSGTRFLALILGTTEQKDQLIAMGKVIGALMSDQIFPMVAYRTTEKEQLIKAVESYTSEVIILAPSVWDPSIRLEPPQKLPSMQKRATLHRYNTRMFYDQESKDSGLAEDASGIKVNFQQGQTYDLYEQFEQEQLLDDKDMVPGGDDGHGPPDASLERSGKFFGGLVLDIKRKLPWYLSDFKDAFHVQSLASIIYIYLATITKAITFGGFLSDITGGQQGVLESFLGHAVAGGLFCLFGGQPLTVLGCTGPVLVFEKILVDFCHDYSIDYMNFRLYIGLWSCLFCLIIVAFDWSAFVRYFTRFTEESFAALIGIIFIVESLSKLHKLSKQYKVHAGFELSHLTFEEEACHCIPPADATPFFSNITFTKPVDFFALQERLNTTLVSPRQIPWDKLTLEECKMFGGKLSGIWCSYAPDIFFFSVTLFFGTFLLAHYLKAFKYTSYFPSVVRCLISDFAVIIAILVFVGVDELFLLETPKLIVPTIFKPTRSDIRGWIIPFIVESTPWYYYILASIPALLLTILLFMDQQITSVIVNRKEHKLKKGCGYHLDMFIIGIMMALCSIVGLPWCVAATVLCLGHVDSLKMETEASAPGERPTFLGVREQRVTGTMVFLLTGLSVKLAPVLKFIPMPVLYGVLLYMGVSSLKGMQLVDRILLMMMPPKYQPDYEYLRHVPLTKVHLFTLVQVLGLALLWILKSTPASLIFPLMVLALVGFRKAMDYFPRVFSQQDLFWLDNLMPVDTRKKSKKGSDEEAPSNDGDEKGDKESGKVSLNLDQDAFLQMSGHPLSETLRRASLCQRLQKETTLC